MEYNRDSTMAAWQHFIETGEIMNDMVRGEVARSWLRCWDIGIDPLGETYPHMSRSVLARTQEENRRVLESAVPCIHLLFAVMAEATVSLSTPELFSYYMLSSYEADPLSYGVYMTEEVCGNTAVSIAAYEKEPIYLHKYEKYRIVDQGYSSAAAPIIVDGELVALLSGGAISNSSPKETYELVCKTGKIIERLLSAKLSKKELFMLLSELIALRHKPVMVIDQSGTIVATNGDCRRFINVADGERTHLSDFLADKGDISVFMDDDVQTHRRCNIKTIYGNIINFSILKKGNFRFADGHIYTAVVFDISPPGAQVRKSTPTPRPVQAQKEKNIEYIGESLSWQKVDKAVRKIARFPSSVLLQGESGTGKELVAHTIHNLSGRSGRFVAVNCGDIPEGLLQSELFGYEKGAFTGANREGSMGKFEYADHGTIFLDEIGDMPLSMQVSLLRFLQERTLLRVGSNKTKSVDVRIIAATNKNIEQMVNEKLFRNDLYYRLSVIGITLPPLRERREDVPRLAQFFIENLSKQYGIPMPKIDYEVFEILKRHDWPGNVRELRNVMEKVLIMSENERITASAMYAYVFNYDSFNSNAAQDALPLSEKEEITRLLERSGGNITRTAAALGITRDTLYRKLKKYAIKT